MIINLTAAARVVPLTALMLGLAYPRGARTTSTAASTGSCKALGLGVLLVLAILSCRADAMPANGGNTVQGFYDALLNTMRNGRTLGQSGRFTQLEAVIRRTFDIPSMARLSVGSSWPTLTEAQRQQVTESLGRYISAMYADRFNTMPDKSCR